MAPTSREDTLEYMADVNARLSHQIGLIAQDYAYAAYWNARGLLDKQGPDDFLGGTASPVLAIPGIYENWHFLTPAIRAMHDEGHPVHVLPQLRRTTAPIAQSAHQVGAYLRDHDLRDVTIFGHSKGGIIGKYAMLREDSEARIRGMIAVCSPFGGSRMARYALTPRLRVFAPTSSFTVGLTGSSDVNARITSIYSRFDPHIPEGSELVGATNIRLPIDGHFQLLGSPLLLDAVRKALDAD